MAEWAAKRFWSATQVVRVEDGFAVRLDDRAIRTPAGRPLRLPTEGLAQALRAEWEAQADIVDPRTMPYTRTANSAIDKVEPERRAVEALLAEYGGTDLLCYRAEGADILVARQSAGWDPLLDWADRTFDARLAVTAGVMPIAQPPGAVANLARPLAGMSAFELAAFHDLVTLSGSLVLALAVHRGEVTAKTAWTLSRIDEEWQAEEWGHDEEADAAAEVKRRAFVDAARFLDLARPAPEPSDRRRN